MTAATSPASSSQRAAGQDGSSATLFGGPDRLRKATIVAASTSSSPRLQEPGFPDGSRSPRSQRCSPSLGPGLAALSRPAMAAAEPDSHQARPRVVSSSARGRLSGRGRCPDRPSVKALDDGADPLPHADAHGGQPQGLVALLQDVEQGGQDAGSRAAQGMTQGD